LVSAIRIVEPVSVDYVVDPQAETWLLGLCVTLNLLAELSNESSHTELPLERKPMEREDNKMLLLVFL
jgi:hypothetical protein